MTTKFKNYLFVTLTWTALASPRCVKAQPSSFLLQNEILSARFDTRGLQAIDDQGLHRTVRLIEAEFSITLDGREIRSRGLKPPKVQQKSASLSYTFESAPYRIQVIYELKPGWHFVSKRLVISTDGSKQSFRVNRVQVLGGNLAEPIADVYVPQSPWIRAGTSVKDYGVFFRLQDRTGIFMLIQNPFLSVSRNGQAFGISYSPEMDWKTGDGRFESDRGCIGTYRLTGEMVPVEMVLEWNWRARGAEGNEATEDQAEIAAFMDCVRAFVLPHPERTVKINVGWTENDYQIDASTEQGREEYRRIIDRAAELGCEHLLYAPSNTSLALTQNDTDSWHWEHVLWLGLGQKIRRGEWDPVASPIPPSVSEMLDYARTKHVKLVAYVYPVLPFSQNPSWLVGKDKDAANLGFRSLQDWLIKNLLNFYRRTGIGGYAFDYTFLNLPGTSEYEQWWGWRRVMESLRRAEPDMVIDGRQAYQLYGPWIWLAGSYPHPTSTDEQPESFKPFPDLHFDRVSADRERYTAYRYRIRDYSPPELMPGYITHQTPRNDDAGKLVSEPFRRRDWDYLGWRYSLISSIAVGGLNNVVDMIPARDPEEFKNFSQEEIAFFRRWLQWTDQNRKYLLNTRFIIGQPAVGRVDGTSALVDDRGTIFLFNPNGGELTAEFNLDQSIGLSGKGEFVLTEVYPHEGRRVGKPGAGRWTYGDRVSLSMAGASALALKVDPAEPSLSEPQVFNVMGSANWSAGILSLTGVRGEIGTTTDALVLLPDGQKTEGATVNGQRFHFHQSENRVTIPIRFEGEQFSAMQQVGSFDPRFAGGTFTSHFSIPGRIFEQLRARGKAWPIPWTEDDLKTTWLAPQRLLLFVQIAEPDDQMNVNLRLDGKPVDLKKAYASVRPHPPSFVGFYADVSELEAGRDYQVQLDLPALRLGQFQGLFFENVEPEYTDHVKQ